MVYVHHEEQKACWWKPQDLHMRNRHPMMRVSSRCPAPEAKGICGAEIVAPWIDDDWFIVDDSGYLYFITPCPSLPFLLQQPSRSTHLPITLVRCYVQISSCSTASPRDKDDTSLIRWHKKYFLFSAWNVTEKGLIVYDHCGTFKTWNTPKPLGLLNAAIRVTDRIIGG